MICVSSIKRVPLLGEKNRETLLRLPRQFPKGDCVNIIFIGLPPLELRRELIDCAIVAGAAMYCGAVKVSG